MGVERGGMQDKGWGLRRKGLGPRGKTEGMEGKGDGMRGRATRRSRFRRAKSFPQQAQRLSTCPAPPPPPLRQQEARSRAGGEGGLASGEGSAGRGGTCSCWVKRASSLRM